MYTFVLLPGHIAVSLRSQGGPHNPHITVNEVDYSPHNEGINFVIVDYDSGNVNTIRIKEPIEESFTPY